MSQQSELDEFKEILPQNEIPLPIATGSSNVNGCFPFSNLPAEIRNIICQSALTTEVIRPRIFAHNLKAHARIRTCLTHLPELGRLDKVSVMNLLLANRQVYAEALAILHDHGSFHIEIVPQYISPLYPIGILDHFDRRMKHVEIDLIWTTFTSYHIELWILRFRHICEALEDFGALESIVVRWRPIRVTYWSCGTIEGDCFRPRKKQALELLQPLRNFHTRRPAATILVWERQEKKGYGMGAICEDNATGSHKELEIYVSEIIAS